MSSLYKIQREAIIESTNAVAAGIDKANTVINQSDAAQKDLFATATDQLSQGISQARGDITSGFEEALNNLFTGFETARLQLGSGTRDALDFANKAFESALTQLQNVSTVDFTEARDAIRKGIANADQQFLGAAEQFGLSTSKSLEELRSINDRIISQIGATRDQVVNSLAPQIQLSQDLATQSAAQLGTLLGFGGDTESALTALENTPGFQFRQKLGQQAIERSAAARGELIGGGTLASLAQFNQDLASQQFDSQVANLQQLLGLDLNTGTAAGSELSRALTSLSGSEANALTQLGLASSNIRSSGAQQLADIARSRAGLSVDQANALSALATGEQTTNTQIQNQLSQQISDLLTKAGLTSADITQQATQAGIGLETGLAQQLAGLNSQQGSSLAALAQALGAGQAGLTTDLAGTLRQSTDQLVDLRLLYGDTVAKHLEDIAAARGGLFIVR